MGAGPCTSGVAFGTARDLRARPSIAGEPPRLEKGDELDYGGSFSEVDIRRRRGNIKTFVLDEIPQAYEFREFIQNLYVKVTAASKRSKTE